MISNNIQKMIGEAMKARDSVRLSTLRMLSSAFNYAKIDNKHDLTEEEEMTVIKKEAKQRKDSIESYKVAGNTDLVASEEAELAILQEFLPPEMSDSDLEKIVLEAIDSIKPTGMADMGKVIGFVKGKAPNADSGKIAMLVKSKLNG
jgi:uncharacterized protein